MDFKAALQAEIEAKKRQINKLKSLNGSSETNDKTKNSVKVADLEKQKQEEYMEKQRALDDQRQVPNHLLLELVNIYIRKNWKTVYQK